MTREEAIEDMARAIFSIAAADDDYTWEDYRDVAAVALDGVRPWVDAQIAAERERADRAEMREKTWHDAALAAKAERDALRQPIAPAEKGPTVTRDAVTDGHSKESLLRAVQNYRDAEAGLRSHIAELEDKNARLRQWHVDAKIACSRRGCERMDRRVQEEEARAEKAEAERDALRERVARLVGAATEVLRISDRKHDAWDALRTALGDK